MARRTVRLADFEMAHLECRMLGHQWNHVVTWTVTGTTYELHFQCGRCTAGRIDLMNKRGQLLGRSYRHAAGYLISNLKALGGRAAFNRSVRGEVVNRFAAGAQARPEEMRKRPRRHLASA